MGNDAVPYFSCVNNMGVSALIKNMVSTTLWLILKVGKDPCLVGDTFQLFLEAFQMFLESSLYSGIHRGLDIAVGVQIWSIGGLENSKEGRSLLCRFFEEERISIKIQVDSYDFTYAISASCIPCLLRVFHMSSKDFSILIVCILNMSS